MNFLSAFLMQTSPMGFPDWYFSLLGGSSGPNYEAIIRMQEKMYGASKVVFLIAFAASVGLYSFQQIFGMKISPRDMALSFFLTLFVMLSYNTIFSTVIEISVAVGDEISSREDREDWASSIRKSSDDQNQTGPGQANSPWSIFSGYLGAAVSMAIGGTPQAIGGIMVACAGAVFLIAMGVIWAIWIILVMTLYAFGPLLVCLGVVPGWGQKVLASWFNALVVLGLWNVYNAMCSWLMTTSAALFLDAAGVGGGTFDPSTFHSGRLLTTGGMTVVYTILLIAGPILIQALVPLSGFLGMASFGVEKGTSTFAGAVSGGATTFGGAMGGMAGGTPEGAGGGFERTPSAPPGA